MRLVLLLLVVVVVVVVVVIASLCSASSLAGCQRDAAAFAAERRAAAPLLLSAGAAARRPQHTSMQLCIDLFCPHGAKQQTSRTQQSQLLLSIDGTQSHGTLLGHSTQRHSICTISFFLSPAAKDIPVSSILP